MVNVGGRTRRVLVITIRDSSLQSRSETEIKPLLIHNWRNRNVTGTSRAWMVVTDVRADNLKESLKDGAGSLHRQPAKEKIAGLPPERANQQLGR